MFISHDLNVVQYLSDRVMSCISQVVETGRSTRSTTTRAIRIRRLLSAMPSMNPDDRTKEAPLVGDPPNPIDPPSGCRFRTRCGFADAVCERPNPP